MSVIFLLNELMTKIDDEGTGISEYVLFINIYLYIYIYIYFSEAKNYRSYATAPSWSICKEWFIMALRKMCIFFFLLLYLPILLNLK